MFGAKWGQVNWERQLWVAWKAKLRNLDFVHEPQDVNYDLQDAKMQKVKRMCDSRMF